MKPRKPDEDYSLSPTIEVYQSPVLGIKKDEDRFIRTKLASGFKHLETKIQEKILRNSVSSLDQLALSKWERSGSTLSVVNVYAKSDSKDSKSLIISASSVGDSPIMLIDGTEKN